MIERIVASIHGRVSIDCRPQKLTDLIEEALWETEPEIRAFELADQYAARVRKRLLQIYCQMVAEGVDPWFEFNSVSPDHVQGPCFIEPCDSELVRSAKAKRLHADPMRSILESLSFEEFEILCAAVASLLGARDFRRTRQSRDQGIDFFARLHLSDYELSGFPFLRFQHNLSVWLVGQAKHYPNGKVSTPEIRNLVGSINLARFKEYASTTELLSEMPIRSCDPVFVVFLTTGTFTRDARQLAENSGVITKDITALANLLADKAIALGNDGRPARSLLTCWARELIQSQGS